MRVVWLLLSVVWLLLAAHAAAQSCSPACPEHAACNTLVPTCACNTGFCGAAVVACFEYNECALRTPVTPLRADLFSGTAPGVWFDPGFYPGLYSLLTTVALGTTVVPPALFSSGLDAFECVVLFPSQDASQCIFAAGGGGAGLYVGTRQGRLMRIRAGEASSLFSDASALSAKCQGSYAAFADGM
jgi:hypothetical protein